MELNANINSFYKGLNLDADVSVLGNDTIRYAENVRLIANSDGTTSIAQNSDYIQKYNIVLPVDNIIIGTVEAKYCDCKDDICTIKDCGVIFTKDQNGYNYVFRIDFDTEQAVEIIGGDFKWDERLSLVSNFESCDVSKVYIADGIHHIRILNISKEYGKVDNTSILDVIPDATLNPLTFVELTTGSLPAGKIQYAYQLFTENGTESAISPLSEIIPVSESIDNSDTREVNGSQPNAFTGKGIKLSTTILNNGFSKIRVFRIVYDIAGQLPKVCIATEVSIAKNNKIVEFTYNDFGTSMLKELSSEEFLSLAHPYLFVPKTIEDKDNRLFAANIKEDTWDVEYDARAYRCDKNGSVVIKDSYRKSYVFPINNIPEIPEDYDCLNPSNIELFSKDSFKYIYKDSGNTIGGKGLNVSYEFTLTEMGLSTQDADLGQDSKNIDLYASSAGYIGSVKVTDYKGNPLKSFATPSGSYANYADAYFASHFVGYQRDEIYRFGIVFYNDKNVASPVHWIGDIRMPYPMDDYSTSGVQHAFHVGVNSSTWNRTIELTGQVLGLKFTVENLPKEVISYEIVRSKRTADNRTIITQGVLSGLINFENWYSDEDLKGIGEKDLRPMPLFNMTGRYDVRRDVDGHNTTNFKFIPGYCEFISPEVCVDRNGTLAEVKKGGTVCPLYWTWCFAGTKLTEKIDGKRRTFTNLGHYPEKIYTTTKDSRYWTDDELDYNDPFVFTVGAFDDREKEMFMGIGTDPYTDKGETSVPFGDEGSSHVFKYYFTKAEGTNKMITYDIEDAIASSMEIPYQLDFTDAKNYQQPIGNKSYIGTSIGGNLQYGIHGRNLVLQLIPNDNYKVDTLYDYVPAAGQYNKARVCNIKKSSTLQHGVYGDRLSASYISCGCYNKASESECYCFGGDTYLCVLDYLNTTFVQRTNDPEYRKADRFHTQCYIPFESSVNLNLLTNKQYHQIIEGGIGQNIIQDQPTSTSAYVQQQAQYTYNTIYSTEGDAYDFISKSMYAKDDMEMTNRIINSEVKINNELTDSWAKFKVANYLDIDNTYGKVTNLKKFGDRLYFFQDNAIGIASVNERSLINDNTAALVLGTGGVLTRYDYLDTTNGDSIINDYSIVNSASTLYWYDFNKNEVCAVNNDVIELSKAKYVQSYYNDAYYKNEDRTRPVSLFNKKYNEVWFKVIDKPLVFNEQMNVFTSFYTHQPDFALMLGDKIVTIKDNAFYEHNESVKADKEVEPLISKLSIIANDSFANTKVFDNVVFYADFANNVNNITEVYFTTKNQTSETVSAQNIECREDTYRFPIPRELMTDTTDRMSYVGRMRGKYLTEFYTFDCNDNKTFKIPYIKTTYRQSML